MPLVQIVATAESQTANTMRMVRAFAPKGSKVVVEHGLDWGKTQFYKTPEGTLEVITSSSNAAEGAEATMIVADESEHWKPSNGGPELAATLEDNLTKSGNRMLETCNAWEPGIGSVAENSWDGWVAQEEGRTRGHSMFFDGSKSRDATALVGCCVSDGHVFVIGAWEPDPSHNADSVVPVTEVDATVRWAFDSWNVQAFFADVKEWESFTKISWPEQYQDKLDIWALPSGKEPQSIAWDMRTKAYDFALAVELTETEIRERQFTHDGDSRMARHVANARRRPSKWGVVSIGKESPDTPRKIDLAVCMIGARMVRRLLLANDSKTRKRTGRVW
jgi:hypothetical protein